ncbi:MAG: metallophosphoesterase, partial [Mucilaginibacter sp.]
MIKFIGAFVFSLVTCLASAQQKKPLIAFTSDTQQPMRVEKIRLKSNHNEKATEMIFNDVDKECPSGLFILGDVVSLGYKNKTWTAVDSYIKQCEKDSIPVFATLGNHEVMFNAKRGTANFKARFPMYNPAGYTEIIDSVAVVLVNSNFSKMTAA